MKAKTKRRIKHIVTKKKLVSKKTSRHFMRSFAIFLATLTTGSLAYAIATTRPTVSVAVHGANANGQLVTASLGATTPQPIVPGAPNQTGRGSWYALGLPAPDAITCASRTFPRGSYLAIKDLHSGLSVTCLVNDYGPEAWTGRVIDLSRGSFQQVDNLGVGTIPVEIRVVSSPRAHKLPIETAISAIVGYRLCAEAHTAQYCESHRQD